MHFDLYKMDRTTGLVHLGDLVHSQNLKSRRRVIEMELFSREGTL